MHYDRPDENHPRCRILYAEIDRLRLEAEKLRGEIIELRRTVQREQQQRTVAERRLDALKRELATR